MALDRDVVAEGLLDDLDRFEQLVRNIGPADWDRATRCAGWTVGDVARHVVGAFADVVAGRMDGLGSPEVTEREVAERAGRSPVELADECAEVRTSVAGMLPLFDDAAWASPAPGGYDGTLGDGVEALWFDTWLHADDIRNAVGRPTETGSGLAGGISHVTFELAKRGWTGDAPDDDAMAWILSATGRTATRPGLINIYGS